MKPSMVVELTVNASTNDSTQEVRGDHSRAKSYLARAFVANIFHWHGSNKTLAEVHPQQ
jgi:hypothetical protein